MADRSRETLEIRAREWATSNPVQDLLGSPSSPGEEIALRKNAFRLLIWIALWLPLAAYAQDTNTTFTTSTTHHETDIRNELPNAQAFLTEIFAYMFRLHPFSDSFPFDETLPAPFADPAVQAAVVAARNSLLANGVLPANIIGPDLIASSSTTGPSTMASNVLLGTNITVTQTTSLGPGTILIGDDQSVTFFVAAGTTNVNTNTAFESFYQNDFQATTTNAAAYQVTGQLLDLAAVPIPLGPWVPIGSAMAIVLLTLARLRRAPRL